MQAWILHLCWSVLLTAATRFLSMIPRGDGRLLCTGSLSSCQWSSIWNISGDCHGLQGVRCMICIILAGVLAHRCIFGRIYGLSSNYPTEFSTFAERSSLTLTSAIVWLRQPTPKRSEHASRLKIWIKQRGWKNLFHNGPTDKASRLFLFCLRSVIRSLRGAFLLCRQRPVALPSYGVEALRACLLGGFLLTLLAATVVYGAGLLIVLHAGARRDHETSYYCPAACRYWTICPTALDGTLQKICRLRHQLRLLVCPRRRWKMLKLLMAWNTQPRACPPPPLLRQSPTGLDQEVAVALSRNTDQKLDSGLTHEQGAARTCLALLTDRLLRCQCMEMQRMGKERRLIMAHHAPEARWTHWTLLNSCIGIFSWAEQVPLPGQWAQQESEGLQWHGINHMLPPRRRLLAILWTPSWRNKERRSLRKTIPSLPTSLATRAEADPGEARTFIPQEVSESLRQTKRTQAPMGPATPPLLRKMVLALLARPRTESKCRKPLPPSLLQKEFFLLLSTSVATRLLQLLHHSVLVLWYFLYHCQVLYLQPLSDDCTGTTGRYIGVHNVCRPNENIFRIQPAPTLSRNTRSCSGPKSRGCNLRLLCTCLLFHCFSRCAVVEAASATDVRVSSLPTGLLGTAPPAGGAVKYSGSSEATLRAADLPAARKRSYRRAIRRATIHGSTRYRGKNFSISELNNIRLPSSINNRPTGNTTPKLGPRMRVLSINFDGMNSPLYDSLQLWLTTAPYDILLMQETHRGFGGDFNEWQAGEWYIVSSPDDKSRFAGVAIAIRKRFARHYGVRSLEVVPGRMLHVRLTGNLYSIDLLSCYQHVISSRDSAALNASRREQYWNKLGSYVAGLPRRNILLLGGDFNCAARKEPGVAGHAAPDANPYYFDQDDFIGFLIANSLCLLNTWSRDVDSGMQTFINGQSNSQIDYIMTRRNTADSISKQAKPLRSLNFSPWRLGARHLPVQASIPLKPGWSSIDKTPTRSHLSYDKAALEHSIYQQDDKAQQLVRDVHQGLEIMSHYSAESLNHLVLQTCARLFPAGAPKQDLRPWQQPDVQTSVKEMWARRAELGRVGHNVRVGLFSRRQIFEAFRTYARFQRSYRALRQRGRWHRKQLLLKQLDQAQQAELRGDVRSLYQVVRKISPKQLGGKVRIRSLAGHLLTPSEEHAEISAYFYELYDGSQTDVEPEARLDPIIITETEMVWSLGQLGSGRAVPPGHAPSSAWKHCREVLAGPLIEAFHSETTAGYPSLWADCKLTLIPKPGKTIKRPNSLRPLGIQDAAGKAIARVIKQHLLVHIKDILAVYPQFAYVQNLSTSDAIQRVAGHCRHIRESVAAERMTVFGKREGRQRSAYNGGAQLLLDMSAAFDRLPRSSLLSALQWAQVPSNLISIIIDIHCVCRYHVLHEGFESFIDMKNGVRQGCTLAPILWSLYSVFLLSQIEDALGSSWPRENMTLYADDTHCAWRLQSEQDLNFMIKSALAIFSVYKRHGMCINPDKSTLLIKLVGTKGASWLKRHIQIKDGKRFFMFQHGTDFVMVPITAQSKYLGIIVSYQNFERASLNHRLKAAGLARQRLAKVLHCSKHLSMRQRLQIYAACIRTTLLYGLTTLGLSDKDLLQLHRRDIKYLRAVAKSPVHITREPTEQLLQRLQVRSIRHVFLKLGGTVLQMHHGAVLSSSQKTTHATPLKELDGATRSCACPTCGLYFPSRHIMKIHHKRKHGVRLYTRVNKNSSVFKTLDVSEHSIDGMPICKHCGLRLSGWQEFRSHILNACPALFSHDIGSEPSTAPVSRVTMPTEGREGLAQRSAAEPLQKQIQAVPEHLSKLQGPQWHKLAMHTAYKSLLKHHCSFCGQWISERSGSLENHLKSAHPGIYQTQKEVRSICQTVSVACTSPCSICGMVFKQRHQCTLLQHLCYVRLALKSRGLQQKHLSFAPDGHDTSRGGEGDVSRACSGPGETGHQGDGTSRDRRGGGQTTEVPSADVQRTGSGERSAEPADGASSGGDRGGSSNPGCFELSGGILREQEPKGQLPAKGLSSGKLGQSVLPWARRSGQPPRMELSRRADLGTKGESRSRPTLRGEDGGEHKDANSSVPSARGRALSDENGERFHSHLRNQIWGSPSKAVQDSNGLEGEERKESGRLLPETGPIHSSAANVVREDEGPGIGRSIEGTGDSPGLCRDPGRDDRTPLVLHEVEPREGGHGEGRGRATHAPLPDPHLSGPSPANHHSPSCSAEVPLYSQDGGELPRRNGNFSPISRSTRSTSLSGLGNADEPVWLCSQQSAGTTPAAHEDGSPTLGEGSGRKVSSDGPTSAPSAEAAVPSSPCEPSAGHCRFAAEGSEGHGGGREESGQLIPPTRLGTPTGFILRNTTNVCYVNSWCHLQHWLGHGLSDTFSHGRLSTAIRILRKQGPTHLLKLLPWKQALSQWRNVHQQQDVSEFAAFLLNFARPEAYKGHWEARIFQAGPPPNTRILDSGLCLTPIALDLTGPTLQHCIYSWYTQANAHALAQAPTTFLLALKRFRLHDSSTDGAIKDMQPVTIQAGELVRIPSFDSNAGLSMTIVIYAVVGVIFHIGNSIKAGHYRTALSGADPTTNKPVFHLSDDNRELQISDCTHDLINTGGYLVGLRRLDSFSHSEGANRP